MGWWSELFIYDARWPIYHSSALVGQIGVGHRQMTMEKVTAVDYMDAESCCSFDDGLDWFLALPLGAASTLFVQKLSGPYIITH
jgi:hypothetical protein